ncbi:MAG: TetR/AcrR family transcriptional regulator [Candidatus Dormibacteraeota bacterium]|nr:TetR/AcrR family transcriptional regulator [Candidatus Dormibacteraeota bacterium]
MSVSIRTAAADPVTPRQWVRRGELLEAARRVFERDGYHAATVSAIVQAAGLSQGAFYLYFPDKKAVFEALQAEMATLLRRRIYWATRDERDPRVRLEAGLRSYFEFYAEYRAWNRRLTTEGLGIDAGFEARHAALNSTLVDAFEPTFTELGVTEPALAGFSLIGMASQVAYAQPFTLASLAPAALARACARLFLDGAAANLTTKGDPHA